VEIARRTVAELHDEFSFLAAIHRLDGDGVLRMVAGAGELLAALDDPDSWEQGIDEGVSGRVARTGDAALVPDTSLDPDFIGPDISRSELALPIRTSRRIWGVLNLESEVPNAFDSDDLLLADTIAWQVGAALDRAELVEEMERRLADGLRQRAGTHLDPVGIDAILTELTDESSASAQ
jgi:GAF domain-containing protein